MSKLIRCLGLPRHVRPIVGGIREIDPCIRIVVLAHGPSSAATSLASFDWNLRTDDRKEVRPRALAGSAHLC